MYFCAFCQESGGSQNAFGVRGVGWIRNDMVGARLTSKLLRYKHMLN